MEHLSGEELARLVDEAPDAAEQIHLDVCRRCSEELSAMVGQRQQLASLCDPAVPLGIRLQIERRLAAEGLLISATRGSKAHWGRAIAAGFVLFVMGGASGSLLTQRMTVDVAPAVTAVAAEPTVAGDQPSPGQKSGTAPTLGTVDEAAAAMQRAEAEYLRAVSRYSELSESGEGLDPLNRLAALEGIMLTTEAALRQAPADPVINNYHLTALGQRDALMRELQLADAEQEWF